MKLTDYLLDNLINLDDTAAGYRMAEEPDYIHIGCFYDKKDDDNIDQIPAIVPIQPDSFNCLFLSAEYAELCREQLQYIALDLLFRMKPDLAKFTFIDLSVQSAFPNICAIQSEQIKFITSFQQLTDEINDLYEHSRHINTQCLRGQYSNLIEYNRKAEYKEAYHFVFIPQSVNSLFPQNYNNSENLKRLWEIIQYGSKNGIYFFIIDTPNPNILQQPYLAVDYQKLSIDSSYNYVCWNNYERLKRYCKRFSFYKNICERETIEFIINKLNQNNDEQQEHYFLDIPIGKSGRDTISLRMGGLVNHGFIAGATGTGKSNLLNKIITSIAEKYSPDELRLYLLDYKEGVEFEMYRDHPNVELLMLDNSDINAGVETLRLLRNEIRNRSELFRQLNQRVRDIDRYNEVSEQKIPRILVIIDEVQKLFANPEFRIKNEIQQLVNNISKQGRAFGIHMLFCSQSYNDCEISSDTLAQMPLRIAFRLANERECNAIMGLDNRNDIPTRLEKFHLVYNDHNGQLRYNIIVRSDYFDETQIENIFAKARIRFKDAQPFERVDPKQLYAEKNDKEEVKTNNDNIIDCPDSNYDNIP